MSQKYSQAKEISKTTTRTINSRNMHLSKVMENTVLSRNWCQKYISFILLPRLNEFKINCDLKRQSALPFTTSVPENAGSQVLHNYTTQHLQNQNIEHSNSPSRRMHIF